MSLEYAETRIKEALELHHGNEAKARQQIIAWTNDDAKLLHALAKPHLSGIVAYNIERVASGRADEARKASIAATKAAPETQEQVPSEEEEFGMEILKAVAGSPEVFGLETPGAPKKRSSVSKSHIDAIRAISKPPPKSE